MTAPVAVRARATARLLWAACRRNPSAGELSAALASGADPQWAARAASRHRVAGLLWRALELAGALEVLGDDNRRLADVVKVQRLRDLMLVPRALDRCLRPLSEAGLEPVVLKGPSVAGAYPAPGLRPFDDLDLLLPRRQHERALTVLGRHGWRVVRPARRDRYDTMLVHDGAPGLPLELHYGLEAWYDRASALAPEALWDRRVPLALGAQQAFALPLAAQLVVLSAHAAKPYHGFSRLVWVVDLAMVLGEAAERHENVDWDGVARLAAAGRCTTALAAALSLAALAGADSPPELRTLPDRGWRGGALRRLVDESWALRETPPVHLRFALAEGNLRRLGLLAGYTHGMAPGDGARWYVRSAGNGVRRWRDLRARRARDDPRGGDEQMAAIS